MKIGVTAGQLLRFIPYQRRLAGDRFPVEANKGGFALGIDQAEGVDAKAFHGAIAARDAAIGHRPHHVVQRFRLQGNIVPERIVSALSLGNGPVGLRLHGVDKVGKLQRVLDKEDRGVVADEVKNPLIGVKLGGEAANIANGVRRPRAALHGGEAHKDRGDFIGCRKKIGFGQGCQAFVGLKVTVGR